MVSGERGTTERSLRRVSRNVLLGLPIVIGGILAIVLGAWDYLPWLRSPELWLGVLVSVVASLWLVRKGAATPRDVLEGVVLGIVLCGAAILVAFAAIILFWVVLRPLG